MPLYIDPRWEYYTADPEIEEILTCAAVVCRMDALFDGIDLKDLGRQSSGLRTGYGNPDRYNTWQAKDRDLPCSIAVAVDYIDDPRAKINDVMLFRAMWNGGATVREIKAMFGIETDLTVRRWRIRLGLLARPAGGSGRRTKCA